MLANSAPPLAEEGDTTPRGARVSGIDAAESLLAIAHERVIDGDFRTGEMKVLPAKCYG